MCVVCEGTARRKSGAVHPRAAGCDHRETIQAQREGGTGSLPSLPPFDRQFLREVKETKEGIIWCLVGRPLARQRCLPAPMPPRLLIRGRFERPHRQTDDRSEGPSGCRYHISGVQRRSSSDNGKRRESEKCNNWVRGGSGSAFPSSSQHSQHAHMRIEDDDDDERECRPLLPLLPISETDDRERERRDGNSS